MNKAFAAALPLLALGYIPSALAQASQSCLAPLVPSTVCASGPVSLPVIAQPTPTPPPGPTPAPSPSGTGVQAVSTDAFLNTTGVVTHAGQGNSPAAYASPIQYLGIRVIRDSGPQAGLIALHQQTGVKVNLIWGDGTIQGLVNEAKALAAAGALASIEGPNEPNNFPITYNGQRGGSTGSWLPLAQYQRDLYAAVKTDSTLRAYPVFSPTEVGAEQDNVGLQFLKIPAGSNIAMPDGTAYADACTVHNYVSAHGSYGDNQATRAADRWGGGFDGLRGECGEATWLKRYPAYSQAQTMTLPAATTETGWDSVSDPGGERVQGVVLVNTYLAQAKAGYVQTHLYHMRDGEGGNEHQGLFHNDWTPKPAGTYIHNLTTVLAGGSGGSPGKLNYSIANEPSTVHDLLLQKSDGTFELVVWGEAVSASNNVTVNLGGPHSAVKIYDVTKGTTPVQLLSNASSVPLTLTDHAMVIEISQN